MKLNRQDSFIVQSSVTNVVATMNNNIKLGFAAFMVLVVLPSISQASLVTWTLDATFISGYDASGTFTYDADTNQYTDINLATGFSDNPKVGNGVYDTEFRDISGARVYVEGSCGSLQYSNSDCVFYFDLARPMTNDGGVIDILAPATFVEEYNSTAGWISSLSSGTVSASVVPVPAAVWLFGTALIGLIGFGKRRKAA